MLHTDLDSSDLEITDIMALLLSIVQLEKMSPSDIYTNKYRIDLLYYFCNVFKRSSKMLMIASGLSVVFIILRIIQKKNLS